ncbi:MAG TPA: hypothetical protein VHO29_01375 [Marmoricola sp.]|nr:hypothetical protein [Marmoricola sp.]
MTVAPLPTHALHHPRLDWSAVGMATLALVMVSTGMITLGIVGFGADDEAFDNWKGVVVGIGLFGGVLVALAACVLAVVARVLREHWRWLWFPLLFGPVFVLTMPLWFE